jgi:hypothetical protein
MSSAWTSDVAQRIEVPFRVVDNAMFVEAVVNGRAVTLLYDSGFSGAFVINNSVDVGRATGVINLRDFVGQFEAPTVPVRSLNFAGKKIDISEMTIVKQDMSSMSLSYGIHVDGLMGFEVVAPYLHEINFEQRKFIFHPRTSIDITKRTPDNKKTFLARMLPKGNNSIEMSVEAANGNKMTLSLDTGNAFYGTTHKDVLERIGIWNPATQPRFMRQSMVASGPVDSWDLVMKDLKIYGVPVAESTWSIIDLPSSSAEGDGTIGFQFLQNFNIIIDMERRRVWLDNFSGKVSNKLEGTVGLYAVHNPGRGRMTVVYVSPDSPAAKAGIKPGDDLLGVEGKELTVLTFDQVLKLLEGEAGTKVKLATSRNGVLTRHELTREVLVNRP